MTIKKLNEQIEKLLEISDETKKSYLGKRQAQADKAQKNLEKAKKIVAKSDKRQISNLPQQTTLENAKAALNALKSEMRKVSSGSDWSLQEEDDGKYLNLSVRYWGQWNDRDEDDDWAPLDDKYKQILDDILVKVQKQYGVQIINQGSEKKWLSFDIYINNEDNFENLDSRFNDDFKEYLTYWMDDDTIPFAELFYVAFMDSTLYTELSTTQFTFGAAPWDDFGVSIYLTNSKNNKPQFTLAWSDSKLFIMSNNNEDIFFKPYSTLKQKGAVLFELDSKLFTPKSISDFSKFLNIAEKESSLLLKKLQEYLKTSDKIQPYEWQLNVEDDGTEDIQVSLSYYVPEPIDDSVELSLGKDGIVHLYCFGETVSYWHVPDTEKIYNFINWANPTKDPNDIPPIPEQMLKQFMSYKELIDHRIEFKNESYNITEAGKDYKHAKELGYSTAQDFNVGDKVQVIWSKRIGTIVKQIAVDVYEVEFPEVGSLMARTDRYYANDLKLI